MTKRYDCLVLGAGMVGVSAAVHLLKRGRSVALVDRRGAAEETSYGNTGIIQTEAVVPYAFPRDVRKLARYAVNGTSEANYHLAALPFVAPKLIRYWYHSAPERALAVSRAFKSIQGAILPEHEALAREAGVIESFRRTGYLKLYRTAEAHDLAIKTDEAHKQAWGIAYQALDRAGVRALEPHLDGPIYGGTLMPETVSVADPSALGKAYAELFRKLGGTVVTGDARTLDQTADGWQIGNFDGPVTARDVVVALGPWADDVMAAQGFKIPMFVKRGYHMHFKSRGNATLSRPSIDTAGGYVLTPMVKGIRLTTGAEFTWRDAPPTPVQLAKCQPMAREIYPLADQVDPKPWLGRRPCLPDMLPMIGPVPGRRGLWADFGHQHWGFTLGPATGRLIAEMVTGEATLVDPFPFRVDRFR